MADALPQEINFYRRETFHPPFSNNYFGPVTRNHTHLSVKDGVEKFDESFESPYEERVGKSMISGEKSVGVQ